MIGPQYDAYRQITERLRHVLLSNAHCEAEGDVIVDVLKRLKNTAIPTGAKAC